MSKLLMSELRITPKLLQIRAMDRSVAGNRDSMDRPAISMNSTKS